MKSYEGPSFGTNEESPNSWGEHVFDGDYDPSVQLTEDELLARDIDSFGRTTEKNRWSGFKSYLSALLMKIALILTN